MKRFQIDTGVIVVSLLIAAAATFIGFWALTVSAHESAVWVSAVRRLGLPLLPGLDSTQWDWMSNFSFRTLLVLGFALWTILVYALLKTVGWRKRKPDV
jgi:hypothetical protein